MHNVFNKSEVFYVYNLNKDTCNVIFGIEDFLKYVANIRESYDFNFSGNDSVVTTRTTEEIYYDEFDEPHKRTLYFYEKELKPIIITDGYGRNVDYRHYLKEAKKRYPEKKEERYWYRNRKYVEYEYGETLVRETWREKKYYGFRQEPVPNVHCYKGGRWAHNPKTKRAKVAFSDPEYGTYLRKGAYPDASWGYRENDRNWKSSYKCKHQWQKNEKR